MTSAVLATLAVALAAPLVVIAAVGALRSPLRLLAVYGMFIPLGSGLVLSPALPAPFNTLSTVTGIAATGALAVQLALGVRRRDVIVPALPVWILFLGVAVTTWLWSVNGDATLRRALVLSSLIALYAVTALTDAEPRDVAWIDGGIILGGALTGAYALFLALSGGLPDTGPTPGRFAIPGSGGEAGDPNVTAATLLLPLVVSLKHTGRRVDRRVRAAGAAGALLTFIGIGLTGSRGGLVAAAVGILVLARIERRRGLTVGIVVGAVLLVALSPLLVTEAVSTRVAETSSTGRTMIWSIGVSACPRHCWVGSGFGTFPDVHEEGLHRHPDSQARLRRFEAHNVFLQSAVETGLLGLGLLLAGLGLAAAEPRGLARSLRAAPQAGLAAVLVSNVFLSNLEFKYFWLALIYPTLVGAAYGQAPVQKEVEASPLGQQPIVRT